MMGFFDLGKKNRNLSQLKQEVDTNPSPLNLVALTEKYVANGELDLARKTITEALLKYKNHLQVNEVYHRILKMCLSDRILELKTRIEGKNPQASDYEHLSSLYYKDLLDWDEALELCRAGLKKYPDNDGLHLLNGLIRLNRFFRECTLQDGSRAREHLQKAFEINPLNIKAEFELARMYAVLGQYDSVRAIVEGIRNKGGDDSSFNDILAVLDEYPRSTQDDFMTRLNQIESDKKLDPVSEAVKNRVYPNQASSPDTQAISKDRLEDRLKELHRLDGFLSASALNKDGTIITGVGSDQISSDSFAQTLCRLYKTAAGSSRKMDIGALLKCEIEADSGTIRFLEWNNLVLGILVSPSTRKQDVQRVMDWLVDSLAL